MLASIWSTRKAPSPVRHPSAAKSSPTVADLTRTQGVAQSTAAFAAGTPSPLALTSRSRNRPAARSPVPPVARILGGLLFLVVVGQRFALPVGSLQIPATLILALFAVVILVASGLVVHDQTRVIIFALALAACALASWLSVWVGGSLHLTSLIMLAACYVPWLFRAPDRVGRVQGASWLADLFIKIMVVAAMVAIVQMGLQITGVWTFADPFATIPDKWLLADFNTLNPLSYGSPIIKSQSFVFLEPSFLSQFLALGCILAMLRRAQIWLILILVVAIFCTYSGTGILLLAVGLFVIMIRTPRALRPSLVVLGCIAACALMLSPFAEPLLSRTAEVSNSESSWSLRFVAPYQQVAGGLAHEPIRYLTGAGPGAADRLLESASDGDGLAVVYTIAPKLIFEYGLIASSLFLLFLGLVLFRRPPWPVLPTALLVMIGLLSGSLLQPHTLVIVWLLSAAWSPE